MTRSNPPILHRIMTITPFSQHRDFRDHAVNAGQEEPTVIGDAVPAAMSVLTGAADQHSRRSFEIRLRVALGMACRDAAIESGVTGKMYQVEGTLLVIETMESSPYFQAARFARRLRENVVNVFEDVPKMLSETGALEELSAWRLATKRSLTPELAVYKEAIDFLCDQVLIVDITIPGREVGDRIDVGPDQIMTYRKNAPDGLVGNDGTATGWEVEQAASEKNPLGFYVISNDRSGGPEIG